MNQLTEIHTQVGSATFVPLITREKFAQLVGVEPGVVLGWCNKGHIPTVSVGRHSLVNVALLSRQALEGGAA